MKTFTIRKNYDEACFRAIERLLEHKLDYEFKEFMSNYGGTSIIEDYFIDNTGTGWTIAAFDSFTNVYSLIKELKDANWGIKLPFAFDPGGWHFCISYDKETLGSIMVNRWTDHEPKDQFIIIAKSFSEFINGLTVNPQDIE